MTLTTPPPNHASGRPAPPQQTAESPPRDVPERPSLRLNVQLVGRTQGSGFADAPFLVQRGGRYLQVTELLYRVLEYADGRRTLEQIAAVVSDRVGLRVKAEQVAQLVGSMLMPAGLVAGADDSSEPAAGVADRDRIGSPLAVNLRMAVIRPGVIDPITSVLQYLYAPPVLVTVLLLAALGHGWLYLAHGVAGDIHNALYRPGLLLIMLAFMVPSAAFHELGHAAALRYGGGRSRAIGAGLYLVYPVFYTDVTDNYRLGRWGRLRTDLGGFYFNLIFALGLLGLYVVTGYEILLLVFVLIDLEIVYQLLPFVRLDGYWVLVDLTGIPDFFASMGAFLRSVLPVPGWRGPRLAPLKWWASAVFGLYILTVVPVLAVLLFLALRSFPSTVATAWDSFLIQTGALARAHAAGDVVGMAESVVHIVSLALPILGLTLIFVGLARRLLGLLWRWSRPLHGGWPMMPRSAPVPER